MSQGNLIVISGPSGAGKGTLVSQLCELMPDVWLSVSATTRKPRPGEVDGIAYYFLSDEEFDNLVEEDGFLEWAAVHLNRYGTLRKAVEDQISQGKQVILEIDVQGALQVKAKMPQAKLVFIEPPSLEELERRLRSRGTDSEESITKRLKNARLELSQKMEYDNVLVNDDLESAINELLQIVQGYASISEEYCS